MFCMRAVRDEVRRSCREAQLPHGPRVREIYSFATEGCHAQRAHRATCHLRPGYAEVSMTSSINGGSPSIWHGRRASPFCSTPCRQYSSARTGVPKHSVIDNPGRSAVTSMLGRRSMPACRHMQSGAAASRRLSTARTLCNSLDNAPLSAGDNLTGEQPRCAGCGAMLQSTSPDIVCSGEHRWFLALLRYLPGIWSVYILQRHGGGFGHGYAFVSVITHITSMSLTLAQ